MKNIAFLKLHSQDLTINKDKVSAEILFAQQAFSEQPCLVHIFEDIKNITTDKFDCLALVMNNNSVEFAENAELEQLVISFHSQVKPVGTISLASLYAAKALKKYNPIITLGENLDQNLTHNNLAKKFKILLEPCPASDFITDRDCKLISTPGWLDQNSTDMDINKGIRLMIKELIEMS